MAEHHTIIPRAMWKVDKSEPAPGCRHTSIIFMPFSGRLGNQLISQANLLALCLEHEPRFSLANASLLPYRGNFSKAECERFGNPSEADQAFAQMLALLFRSQRLYRALSHRVPNLKWESAHIVVDDSRRLELDEPLPPGFGAKTLFLSGWGINSGPLLYRHRRRILEHLAFKIDHRRIDEIVSRARNGCDVLIGVHIRQGDYRSFANGIHYFSSGEYASAMRDLAQRISPLRVSFLVCSNSPQRDADFEGLDVSVCRDTTPTDDMTILSRCDMIFGPPSTFSFWASYMSGVALANTAAGKCTAELTDTQLSKILSSIRRPP
jgi:hypothetical protein